MSGPRKGRGFEITIERAREVVNGAPVNSGPLLFDHVQKQLQAAYEQGRTDALREERERSLRLAASLTEGLRQDAENRARAAARELEDYVRSIGKVTT